MALIQSAGKVEALDEQWRPSTTHARTLQLYGNLFQDYAAIYRTQPNVRTCVSFLARNLAQLGIKVYRRVSDTDRAHLADHDLASLLKRPIPDPRSKLTRYRLVDRLVHDLGIYFDAYWLKVRAEDRVAIVPMPPTMMFPIGNRVWGVPEAYEIRGRKSKIEVPADQVVHFYGYNPDSPFEGLSPLETLRRTLAEEAAAGEHREAFWRNAARIDGVLQRPKDATPLSGPARDRLRAEWKALYSGVDRAGNTAILEEGMEFKEVSFSPKDAEYIAARKLTREECAAAFHIPLPMVGILEHATYSNITEQHKNLYQDCLAPWTVMIEQDIELQLLPEFTDTDRVYVSFLLEEKMKGSFEDQATSLQTMVGRPVMTANEGRARLDLPSLDDPGADQLVTPLNVLVGGQASPRDSAPKRSALRRGRKDFAEQGHLAKHEEVLEGFFGRQRDAVVAKLGAKAADPDLDDIFDEDRWNTELGTDLLALARQTVEEAGGALAADYEAEFDVDDTMPYLEENARIAAENINATTRDQIGDALDDDDAMEAIRNVFAVALSARVAQIARTRVTTTANFGRTAAAKSVGLNEKTWVVTSGRPRASHAAMSGETVEIGETFSNGALWPGDASLPVEEVANCTCQVDFSFAE